MVDFWPVLCLASHHQCPVERTPAPCDSEEGEGTAEAWGSGGLSSNPGFAADLLWTWKPHCRLWACFPPSSNTNADVRLVSEQERGEAKAGAWPWVHLYSSEVLGTSGTEGGLFRMPEVSGGLGLHGPCLGPGSACPGLH